MVTPTDPRDIAPICEAIAAPVLAERGPAPLQARGGRARLLKTESGRTVTHGEVMAGLLVRAEIEVAVVDGKRPEWIKCQTCHVPVKVKPMGGIPKKCRVCSGSVCCECGRKRHGDGERGMCRKCAVKAGKWIDVSRKLQETISHESRSEKAKEAWANMTPEKRAERVSKTLGNKTKEQRSEMVRKIWASKTPEERSRIARERESKRTPEQQRAKGEKIAATRRAKKAAEAAQ